VTASPPPRTASRSHCRRVGASLAAVAATLLLAACGGSGHPTAATAGLRGAAPPRPVHATLVLDFVPNAVHAGVYRALAAGYYRREGIDLSVRVPSATTDTLRLIDAGSAQFGLADGSDVAQLIAAGGDARTVMALVQQPVGALIARADEHLSSPAGLQGRTVGITGVPSDTATLDTEVRHAGGDPAKVRVVTIGFSGAQALASGKLSAFTGFWPDDGVSLQVTGTPITIFTLNGNGGPDYPGLVAFTTRRLIATDPGLVRAFVAATVHGYQDTLADPQRSLKDLYALVPGLDRRETAASLRAYLPLFHAGGGPLGTIHPAAVRALSAWMVAHRLIHRPVAPASYATNAFLPDGNGG
jgi:putative hydroxymethylpyrimidine transport system substrate-binding protein